MTTEERVTLIEEAILLMKDLLISHNGRLDDYHEKFQQSRLDFEFKMNAVIDAQLKNESEISDLKESTRKLEISTTKLGASTTRLEASTSKLKESTSKLKESTTDLRDASRLQLKRIERLEQI